MYFSFVFFVNYRLLRRRAFSNPSTSSPALVQNRPSRFWITIRSNQFALPIHEINQAFVDHASWAHQGPCEPPQCLVKLTYEAAACCQTPKQKFPQGSTETRTAMMINRTSPWFPSPTAAAQSTHLVAWTVPSGQIRVTAARCREIARKEVHRPPAAANPDQTTRPRKSRSVQLTKNRAMHRLQVRKYAALVVGATRNIWPTALFIKVKMNSRFSTCGHERLVRRGQDT